MLLRADAMQCPLYLYVRNPWVETHGYRQRSLRDGDHSLRCLSVYGACHLQQLFQICSYLGFKGRIGQPRQDRICW